MAIQRLDGDSYRSMPGVNYSTLKQMARSPRHYRWRLDHPLEDTPRLALGRAVHTATLEPEQFLREYALWKGERRAGKEYEAFCAANVGRTVLKTDEYETALRISEAVRSHRAAGPLLRGVQTEMSVTWTDEATGLALKARVDAFGIVQLDLKSTSEIDGLRFGAQAARMQYHAQASMYQDGLRANGLDLPVRIIAVEADDPHDVAVYRVEDDALEAGRRVYVEWLRSVSQCETLGMWPGRYEAEVPLRLPTWALTQNDEATGMALALAGQSWEE